MGHQQQLETQHQLQLETQHQQQQLETQQQREQHQQPHLQPPLPACWEEWMCVETTPSLKSMLRNAVWPPSPAKLSPARTGPVCVMEPTCKQEQRAGRAPRAMEPV